MAAHAIHVASSLVEPARRQRIYDGDVFVLEPSPSSLALREFAAGMVERAFAPLDPVDAQHHLTVERFVEIFAPLKPAFIHHAETRRLMRELLVEQGCDAGDTYLDVPRLRGMTSDGYLTAGVGYALPLHRDTWWSAPLSQVNWWMPLYPFDGDSSMAFHPRYWSEGVENHSEEFNYYAYNATGRARAAEHVTTDDRQQPHPPDDIERDPEVRVVTPPGWLVVFAAAQMHSTVPNTSGRTRFSIDFRTVSLSDLEAGRAAPNVDSHPEGTSLRDFRRVADDAPMPPEIVERYDSGEIPDGGVLVFRPEASSSAHHQAR